MLQIDFECKGKHLKQKTAQNGLKMLIFIKYRYFLHLFIVIMTKIIFISKQMTLIPFIINLFVTKNIHIQTI